MSKYAKLTTKDKDLGYTKIITDIKKLNGVSINAGVFAGTGTSKRSGLDIFEYAYFNEFGTSKIPARSFIRSTFDDRHKFWIKEVSEELTSIINDNKSIPDALNAIGSTMSNDIKDKITNLQEPPNAPSTVKRKGFNDPLVETGQLRSAITYKIEGLQ